jgi:putative hydrolase of the HAD superfamily
MDPEPEVILFDAGGTLVLQSAAAISEQLGFPIDPDRAFEAHYRSMHAYARRRMTGVDDGWAWWQQHYFTSLGVPDPELAGERINNGFGLWYHPIAGTIQAVAEISKAGIRTAVLSNSDGSVTESLSRAGFDGLFEMVLDSHNLGVSKPDPAIFRLALERMSVAPSRTWYVGDSIFHDVGGATTAGLARAILIDPLDLHEHYHDRVRSVADLAELVSGVG